MKADIPRRHPRGPAFSTDAVRIGFGILLLISCLPALAQQSAEEPSTQTSTLSGAGVRDTRSFGGPDLVDNQIRDDDAISIDKTDVGSNNAIPVKAEIEVAICGMCQRQVGKEQPCQQGKYESKKYTPSLPFFVLHDTHKAKQSQTKQ